MSNNSDGNIGGRNINEWLLNDIKNEIKNNGYKIINNDKTEYKLLLAIENLKIKLSGESANEVNITVEDILSDNSDYIIKYTIEKLNKLLENHKIFERIDDLINNSINESKWSENDIKNIEICIVGGSMRIKYIKEKLIEYLNNKTHNNSILNTTLNMEECICQGVSYYGVIMNHIKTCHKAKCNNKLHYYIEDLSSYKHINNNEIVKNDIEKIRINVMKYDERDVVENEKSLKKHLIEETQYNASRLLEEKKLFSSEYKEYVCYTKQYFNYILTWIENNNINEISYNELKAISDDEITHYKILKGIYDNQIKRINLDLYYITNIMFDKDISIIIMDEIKKSDIRNFKSKIVYINIFKLYIVY